MTQHEWKLRFRDKLLTVLKERNMNQSQLAAATGLSASRISDYINMKATPTIYAIVNISYALDIPAQELTDFNERIRG